MSDSNQYTHCLPEGTELKGYRIEKVLGKGGFGITYLAEDMRLKKRVAIKELLPDGIATRGTGHTVTAQSSGQESDFRWAVESFLQEAQILAGFEHPNIVHVYRLFEAHNTAYMVMPYVEGVSLKDMVKSQQCLAYEDVRRIHGLLMDGLEVVHGADTLHRDVKPDNVIITNKGVPMLIDFGSARQQISGKTRDITSIITPGYAPVEQYSTDAKYQGPWSDIYALAACTYFMITGDQPIPASERNDALRNRQSDPLPKLAELAPAGYPAVFLQAIDRGLHMEEAQRPQSINDWRNSISSGVPAPPLPPIQGSQAHAQPQQSKVTSHPPAFPTPKKKSKLLIFSVSAIVLALLAAGGLLLWNNLSDDPKKSDGDAQEKLAQVVTYLDANKPLKAKSTLEEIDRGDLTNKQKKRHVRLSREIKELISNAKAIVSLDVDPSSAQIYLDGEKCKFSNGKIEVLGIGNHVLKISANGYQTRSINFETKGGASTVSLSKVSLKPNKRIEDIAKLISGLNRALEKKDYTSVLNYYDRLNGATIPENLTQKASDALSRARTYKAKYRWQVTLVTRPSDAKIYLNGARIHLRNSTFRVTRSGSHTLRFSADGYEGRSKTFTLNKNGSPIDLGTISLVGKEKEGEKPVAKMSKEEASRIARSYVQYGNSTHANDAQMQFISAMLFFGKDQSKQQKKEAVKKQVTELFKRWKKRTFTILDVKPVVRHKSGGSWVVTINYSFEWNDGIFTLKGKRQGRFAVMPIGGKPLIVAYISNSQGKDTRTFSEKTLISTLKSHNQKRLSAGDSEGGESIWGEASYYSNKTEYYGARTFTRAQIAAKCRGDRAKSDFRLFVVKSYSDFKHIVDAPSGRGTVFTYKCKVEVHKGNRKSTRMESIRVKFENGKPYVTTVRY